MNDETRTETGSGLPRPDSGRPESSALPTSLGPYRIVSKLGEGGMGVVYEAEQQQPRRNVALKVIRGGQFVDDGQIKLFQREADTLARLKHPNIAAIYESGHTDDGQHFFAMELVRGQTLGEWMRSRTSPAADTPGELKLRLALFGKICDAVHYAHQRGVIHRDLKPSNVIVLEPSESTNESMSSTRSTVASPEIKILDFGLARITDSDVAAASMVTEIGVIKGTLPYMSPEQARGNPDAIDQRTDIYSLGVMLYELLTAKRPYDTQTGSLVEAVRVICETPATSIHVHRSTTSRIDDDIATIVGKALEKEADRRYASAAALSDDLQRYLTSQPISARPPSTSYQLRKFAARNRALVGGIAATFVVLVAGAVVSTMFALKESAQRKEVEAARNDLQSVVDFQADMLRGIDPAAMGNSLSEILRERIESAATEQTPPGSEGNERLEAFEGALASINMTDAARNLIDQSIFERSVASIDESFANQPLVGARLRDALGTTARELGIYARAEPQLKAALEIRQRELGPDHPDTLRSMNMMGNLLQSQSRFDEARPYYEEALERRRRLLGANHPLTMESMGNLGTLMFAQGNWEEGEPYLRERLAYSRANAGDLDHDTGVALNSLGLLLKAAGRAEEAEPMLREALEVFKVSQGEEHPATLSALNSLGVLLESLGKEQEAADLQLRALEGQRRTLGEDHPSTLGSMYNLAISLERMQRYDEALAMKHQVVAGLERSLGPTHANALTVKHGLALSLQRRKDLDGAEELLDEVYAGFDSTLGPDHPETLNVINSLAVLYKDRGDRKRAEQFYRTAIDGYRRVAGPDHPRTLGVLASLAYLLKLEDRLDEAIAIQRELSAGSERALGPEHSETLKRNRDLGEMLSLDGQYADGDALLQTCLELSARTVGPDDFATLAIRLRLARSWHRQERFEEAETELLALHATLEQKENAAAWINALAVLAELYESWGKADLAAKWS